MNQVVIVGGGISGLASAYFLEKRARESSGDSPDFSILLMEERQRTGGVILSEYLDGCLLEGGPDSFLAQKPAAIELCRELGLADQLLPSNDNQRKTFILQGGALKELPDGLLFMVPTKMWPIFRSNLFSLSGKIRLMVAPLLPVPQVQGDIAVADFISRRLGRQAFENLAEPLLAAVYGADVGTLSTRAALPQFLAMEEKYGSLWKGIRAARRKVSIEKKITKRSAASAGSIFVSLRDGVGQLTATLEKSLTRTRIVTGRKIEKICRAGAGSSFRVQWRDGETEASAVILATPAHAAGKMLGSLDGQLAEKLSGICYNSTVTVSLGFEEAGFGRTLDGFGFVVARGEGKRMLACTWVSSKFPFRCPPGRVLLRCFLGGARDPSINGENDNEIRRIVLRELGEIMSVRTEPIFTRIHRWERSMPQYNVGHLIRIQEIFAALSSQPGLFLAGNAYRGVGIPDCINSASDAASAAHRFLQSLVPVNT